MHKFNSIDELRSKKARLYFRQAELEMEIKNDFSALKHSLTPTGIFEKIKSTSHSAKEKEPASENPGILNNMGAAFIDLLLSDMFMRRTSYIKRFVTSYLVRLVGPSLLQNAGPLLSNLIKRSHLFDHLGKKSSHNGHHDEPVYTRGI